MVKLDAKIEHILADEFGVETSVSVVSVAEFREVVEHAPEWWGGMSNSKHDALFVIAPAFAEEIINEVGGAKPEYENLAFYKGRRLSGYPHIKK